MDKDTQGRTSTLSKQQQAEQLISATVEFQQQGRTYFGDNWPTKLSELVAHTNPREYINQFQGGDAA